MNAYAVQLDKQGRIAVDDTLLVQGVAATAGSHILQGFVPLFTATAVSRLQEAGYTLAGKTHVGEFGLDLVGEFCHDAPQTTGRLAGAAAGLVAGGEVQAALGVDVNGGPRRAAALAGVDFLKPTYGTVSRYGVISTAASGEQVGVYAATAAGVGQIMQQIAGHDEKDGTSLPQQPCTYQPAPSVAGMKVALAENLLQQADPATRQRVEQAAAALRAAGAAVCPVQTELFELAQAAWQILMAAETCNNLSRYDGVKFGFRAQEYKDIDELYVNTRTQGFNFLTKAVVLYGSDVLSKNRYAACYDKALRVRRVVAEGYKQLLGGYDALLAPACSQTAYEAYDIHQAFERVNGESLFSAIANLIGTPALVTCGVQLLGDHFAEDRLLSLADSLERAGDKA